MRRPHNDTRINASNVSSFNWVPQTLFTQFGLENPRSHIVVLAKLKLQSMPSRRCRIEIAGIVGIWKCFLECQDWTPTMLQFANCSHCILWYAISREAFTVTDANFAVHIFVKCPPPKKKNTSLTAKMSFDMCWRLQYWTLRVWMLKNNFVLDSIRVDIPCKHLLNVLIYRFYHQLTKDVITATEVHQDCLWLWFWYCVVIDLLIESSTDLICDGIHCQNLVRQVVLMQHLIRIMLKSQDQPYATCS